MFKTLVDFEGITWHYIPRMVLLNGYHSRVRLVHLEAWSLSLQHVSISVQNHISSKREVSVTIVKNPNAIYIFYLVTFHIKFETAIVMSLKTLLK
jgi:hypothetical protein